MLKDTIIKILKFTGIYLIIFIPVLSALTFFNYLYITVNSYTIEPVALFTQLFFIATTASMFLCYNLLLIKNKHTTTVFLIPLLLTILLNLLFYLFVPETAFLVHDMNENNGILYRPEFIRFIFRYLDMMLMNLIRMRNESLIEFILIILTYTFTAASLYKLTKPTRWKQLNYLITLAVAAGYLIFVPFFIEQAIIPFADLSRGTSNPELLLAGSLMTLSLITSLLTIKMGRSSDD